ncbi:arabinose efflux permease family protein [Leptolyngbyaceae cyanobacterium JSC-12]|nr:arabinose efflux permease family protein [Leptolyngbyaceae cyanobacterium JSC-12]
MKVFQTLLPQQQRNLTFLFLAGLLFWSSLASMLPVLSLYIKDTGATNFEIGVVMGAFAIGLLLFRPWVGQLADKHDRKLVLYIGLAAVAIAPLGYLMTQSIPLLIAVRAFHGLSIAAFSTGFSALVADLAPSQSRGEIIGYMTLVNPIGVAVGPALGGFLQAWVGYAPLFWVSAGLGVAGVVAVHQLKTSSSALKTPQASGFSRAFWQLLVSPRLRIPALVLALIGVAFGTLAIFVPLFIKESGIHLNPGLFYTMAAIASFVVRIAVGRASDQFGRGRFITGSLVLYTMSLTLLAIAHSVPTFLLAGFLEGAGGGILIPMMIALAADRSSAQERGRIFGLVLAGFDLGMALAGPMFGYLALFLGYRGLFSLSAILSALALLIFISFSSKDFAHSLRFSLGRGRDLYSLPKGSTS